MKLTITAKRSELDLIPAVVPSLAPIVSTFKDTIRRASITGEVEVGNEHGDGVADIEITLTPD